MNLCEKNDIVFISDLHLSENRPNINSFFIKFLKEITLKAKALYILGDFFEYFVGEDENTLFRETILDALKWSVQSGLAIYFMHGNRDFLLGSDFFQKTGCQILKDPSVIDIQNQGILLAHGDGFCTADRGYQRFRKLMRQSWAQWVFLHFPLRLRKKIANRLKMQSMKKTDFNPMKMDVVRESIESVMHHMNVFLLIHGHTHKPAMHLWKNHLGRSCQRWVLGAWDENPYYLLWSSERKQFFLEQLNIPVVL